MDINTAPDEGAVPTPAPLSYQQLPTKAVRDAEDKEAIAAGLVPPNRLCKEDLFEWYEMSEKLSKLKASEMLMRVKIRKVMFPADAKEGTSTLDLADGYVIKLGNTVNRSVDEPVLLAMSTRDAESGKSVFEANGINIDTLIKRKPELIKGVYNTLTAEQQKLVDRALDIKPGAPALEIMMPKKNMPKVKG